MSDPFVLLRRARSIIDQHREEIGARADGWLREYAKLPGATLTVQEVHVLRHPELRCRHNRDTVLKLMEDGYLDSVSNVRQQTTMVQVRRSLLGREALRLRGDVPHMHEGAKCE